MAWRPWYQPQLPHTMWGSLVAPQRGQVLRDGALTVHAEARRLRLLALEVFFLGTAMIVDASEVTVRLGSADSQWGDPLGDLASDANGKA